MLLLSLCLKSRLQYHFYIILKAFADCFEARLLLDFKNAKDLLPFICFFSSLRFLYVVFLRRPAIFELTQSATTFQLQKKIEPSICLKSIIEFMNHFRSWIKFHFTSSDL